LEYIAARRTCARSSAAAAMASTMTRPARPAAARRPADAQELLFRAVARRTVSQRLRRRAAEPRRESWRSWRAAITSAIDSVSAVAAAFDAAACNVE